MKYVGRDWAVITRKPGSNFLPSKTIDCRILGSGVYILGGGVWWGYTLSSGGGGCVILVVMGGGGEYLLGGVGWW